MTSSTPPLDSVSPTQPVDLETGLTLISRIKLLLTLHRADKSVSPIDEWKLKNSLINYMKATHSITVPEEDLILKKFKDLKKRKREDPVARGTLFVYDLGFLNKAAAKSLSNGDEEDVKMVEKRYVEKRRGIVGGMDGMDLSIEGSKFKLSVSVPVSDDFDGMRKDWEENAAFGNRGYYRGGRQQPDTIILRRVPSRWFAEPRVSSKPSMLVTHTIFSMFGKIRNLDVAEDDGIGNNADEEDDDLVSGLHCKIVVRFEKHADFCNALKLLCGRSLQKQGSRLRADYEVTWDKDGFFRNSRSQAEEKNRWTSATEVNYRSEASRHQSSMSRRSPDHARRKRFRD